MIRVECFSGHKADERPVRFQLNGRDYAIVAVLDQWYGPDHIFFKIRADDGRIYLLRHETTFARDAWAVI